MKKLVRYLKRENMTVAKFAGKLKLPYITVYTWATGKGLPNVANAVKVERATKGAISVYDWA